MDVKSKLKRMRPHLTNQAEPAKKKNVEAGSDIPFIKQWEKHGVVPYWLDEEYCLIREVHYPLSFNQGKYTLGECLDAVAAWQQTNFSHPLSTKGHSHKDLFFFDTETTGLRGVGSTIFLLGYAQFTDEGVTLRQHILTEPGFEVPLYMSFLKNVNYTTLVTYNGKSFDWPQVKSRHTLIRDHVPRLPKVGHFDLYHASRRMWKHKLESVKLAEVEKHILAYERKDDLPGYLAPAIYFDFVERKDPEGMLKVLDHNEKDILSLISLYTHVTNQLLGIDQNQTSSEKVEAGKWYKSSGDKKASDQLLEDALSLEKSNLGAAHALAYSEKRKGHLTRATRLWEMVAKEGTDREKRESLIELAKIYEHCEKNSKKAIHCTELAIEVVSADIRLKKASKVAFQKAASHRLTRLARK